MAEQATPQSFDWDAFAERLLKKAEVFERHQHLGHFRIYDGSKTAAELRDLARQIKDESLPIQAQHSSGPEV